MPQLRDRRAEPRWFLWFGRCGFGFKLRGVERQFYRNVDGSLPARWVTYTFRD